MVLPGILFFEVKTVKNSDGFASRSSVYLGSTSKLNTHRNPDFNPGNTETNNNSVTSLFELGNEGKAETIEVAPEYRRVEAATERQTAVQRTAEPTAAA